MPPRGIKKEKFRGGYLEDEGLNAIGSFPEQKQKQDKMWCGG